MARAFGPDGVGGRQFPQVLFVLEARQCIVGLRLQIGRFDPAIAGGDQLVHAAPVHQVGDQRGDEHCLARARQPRHAKADDRIGKGGGHRMGDAVDGASDLPSDAG